MFDYPPPWKLMKIIQKKHEQKRFATTPLHMVMKLKIRFDYNIKFKQNKIKST